MYQAIYRKGSLTKVWKTSFSGIRGDNRVAYVEGDDGTLHPVRDQLDICKALTGRSLDAHIDDELASLQKEIALWVSLGAEHRSGTPEVPENLKPDDILLEINPTDSEPGMMFAVSLQSLIESAVEDYFDSSDQIDALQKLSASLSVAAMKVDQAIAEFSGEGHSGE